MAGHSAELERWLKPRGWTMKMGGNGHWKLYHEQCPHPLSASNTPSGPAIKKIQSVVMRTERQFGIIVEERRKGRPVTEPFKTRTEGDSVFHTAVCSECGETGEIRSQASSATITPAHITTRFRQKGWKSKAYRSEDLCPSCNGADVGPAETKPVAEKPKPVTPVTLADIPLPPPPQARHRPHQRRSLAAPAARLETQDRRPALEGLPRRRGIPAGRFRRNRCQEGWQCTERAGRDRPAGSLRPGSQGAAA